MRNDEGGRREKGGREGRRERTHLLRIVQLLGLGGVFHPLHLLDGLLELNPLGLSRLLEELRVGLEILVELLGGMRMTMGTRMGTRTGRG